MSAVSPQLPAKLEKRWNIWAFRPIISAYNRIKNNSCTNMYANNTTNNEIKFTKNLVCFVN